MKYLLQQYTGSDWKEIVEVDTILSLYFWIQKISISEMVLGKYRILSDMDARYPISKEDFDNDKWA